MKIVNITKSTVYDVDIDDDEWGIYTRHGAGIWSVRMGESDEPVYNEDKITELEKLFQKWITHNIVNA